MLLVTYISSFFKKNKIKTTLFCVLFFLFWLWLPNQLFKNEYSTVLVDENDQLLAAQISNDEQWRFPQSDSVPQKFKTCIITFEDEYFYCHPGFNPISIFKSVKRNIASGEIKSGGSTITMQLARMMRGNQPRNYYQKMIELLLALRIELSYKKSSILNLYCSNAPFGSNVVGLFAASWRYYGRNPDKLSWAENALLAVLPNAPSLIYPGKNHERLLIKRNRLLNKLLINHKIDSTTYLLAIREELPQKPHPIPQLANHLLNRCINEQGKSKIFQSTLQKKLQIQVNDLLNKHIQNLRGNQINNACAIVAEIGTGKVLAYVGNSFSKNNEHENYVDIINSPRSTGSILKPFLYAFMLSENKILPTSLIEDVPTQIGSYGPKNFNLSYDGLVPANQALSRSLNVPAVKLLQEYGVASFHQRLKQLGFKTFNKPSSHYGLSLILGGGEANLWDITSAYAGMGRALLHYSNDRNKYAVNSYHSLFVLNNTLRHKNADVQSSDLIKASAIYFTFNAMTELLRPNDYVGWMQFLSKNKIAWKTGTSFGFRDAWSVGLNSKYVVAVWVGNADGEGRPELTGTTAAAPLMFSVFNCLPKSSWFPKPLANLQKVNMCKQSGFKASRICPDIDEGYYTTGAEKTMPCPFHKIIHLDESSTYRVNSNCYQVDKMQHKAWFIVSPMQEYFFKQSSLFYKQLPPYLAGCQGELSYSQLEIIYPKEGCKIYIPIDESGNKSKCVFKATHKNAKEILYWYLDGAYIGSTQKFHQFSFLPNEGSHSLEIADSFGETVKCNFDVLNK